MPALEGPLTVADTCASRKITPFLARLSILGVCMSLLPMNQKSLYPASSSTMTSMLGFSVWDEVRLLQAVPAKVVVLNKHKESDVNFMFLFFFV